MFESITPVTLTTKAAEEVRKIRETKTISPEYGLRVGVQSGGGCGSGSSLIIGFDKKKDADIEYTSEGITMYIDKKHTLYLIGKAVDFIETAEVRGFMFVDPEPAV